MPEPHVPTGQRIGPLEDTTVLELGHIVAGPFCSLILADSGADVIKVENRDRGGDSVRNSSELGTSLFNAMNRNKRSITLNLKSAEGLAIFEQLVADTDILIENFAPGVTERLNVDYESLSEINSSLVYCSISGFGDGPYKNYPALDPVTEALSGLMSVTGCPENSQSGLSLITTVSRSVSYRLNRSSSERFAGTALRTPSAVQTARVTISQNSVNGHRHIFPVKIPPDVLEQEAHHKQQQTKPSVSRTR
jgi:hypothetical protein